MVDIALAKYNPKRNKSFYTYWLKIANNSMKQFVKNYLNTHVDASNLSLDQENDFGGTLHDSISDDVDEQINLYNSLMNLISNKNNDFTDMEKKIITLFLDGYEIREISEQLGTNKVRIYRGYHSAINKIRRSIMKK